MNKIIALVLHAFKNRMGHDPHLFSHLTNAIGIDLSYQMSSHGSLVMGWYKVAEELLLACSVVTAWLVYRKHLCALSKKNKYSITSFKNKLFTTASLIMRTSL